MSTECLKASTQRQQMSIVFIIVAWYSYNEAVGARHQTFCRKIKCGYFYPENVNFQAQNVNLFSAGLWYNIRCGRVGAEQAPTKTARPCKNLWLNSHIFLPLDTLVMPLYHLQCGTARKIKGVFAKRWLLQALFALARLKKANELHKRAKNLQWMA